MRRVGRLIPAGVMLLFLTAALPGQGSAQSEKPDLLGATIKGARHVSGTFGASYDSHLGHTFLWQFAVRHYIFDHIALSYGGLVGYASPQRTKDGIFGGPQFGLRWHIIRGERWSFDIEGLAAAVFHQHPLTESSLHFNFDLQPGLGLTWMLDKNTMIRAGARWHHLSNARIQGEEHNLGYDGPMAYLEMSRSF